IRSVFLGKIKDAYERNPELQNLVLDPYFNQTLATLVPAWRNSTARCARSRG
ncbi:MAG: NADP-dependent phosphogluconate dehydrogenase, partial [Tidjanibacter sp.]|nr:NADP-dependent phosphogluconate dehydrogenase [Tidjanibacter sp.]